MYCCRTRLLLELPPVDIGFRVCLIIEPATVAAMGFAQSPPLDGSEPGLTKDKDAADAGLVDDALPRSADGTDDDSWTEDGRSGKGKKRSLFGFGKKKTAAWAGPNSGREMPSLSKDSSKLSATSQATRSPPQIAQSESGCSILPSTPYRGISASPRVISPAGSQIFERDVQDSTILKPGSPAIPKHIQTENYIPPVLDDASEAITNKKLDPDTVEIVTHTWHQPASVTVTGVGSSSIPNEQVTGEWAAELASFADRVGLAHDNASNYGSLDSADVRRLSFISFADVVQAEHTGHPGASSRDSIHQAGFSSFPPPTLNRSPSPILQSPVSSQGPGTSPPTSNPGSFLGAETSPPRKLMGSPAAMSDLNIETMRQALRRTGSTDLGSTRGMLVGPADGSAGSR